ncbi:hypothetical protein FSP39_002805 [Pinctada imbricata]|uniref:Uncharacterized protein n=1 Tax=Pinctada imbricata TaxID=66713 RepID=A0AA88YMW4_PINIB|nr:hypothetical protein FSP39_002805 [Pinctada imbricata]
MSRQDSDSSADSLLDQISAFEKLLRHAMARSSKERLYDMLQTVQIEMTNSVRYPKSARTAGEANKPSTAPIIKVKSVSQVRSTVKSIEKKGEKSWTDKERQAIKYFDVFQKDVNYLSDLKKYFTENIHSVLLKDYFDPADRVKKPSTARSDISTGSGRGLNSRSNSKNNIKVAKKSQTTTNKNDHQQEKVRLSELITEMDDITSKWSGLLADRELNIEDFDPDSQHELMQFSNFATFEAVLRLIPDVFVKCYKAIDVGREWWKLANIIYSSRLPLKSKHTPPTKQPVSKPPPAKTSPNPSEEKNPEETRPAKTPPAKSPVANSPVKTPPAKTSPSSTPSPKPEEVVDEFAKAAKEIKQNITEITESIRENEMKLENLGDEIKSMEARDERVNDLTNDFESMDSKLQSAQEEYTNFLSERQRTIDEISRVPRGSDQHYDLMKRANSMDLEIQKKQGQLRMMEFEKSVLQEDYLLELELRPSFIHFLGDIQQQVLDIKEDISQKQLEKSHLEKQLSVLKTNTDKMKKEMAKYLNEEESNEFSRQLSELTKGIEEDLRDIDIKNLETDRSFVSESDDVDLDEYLTGNKFENIYSGSIRESEKEVSHIRPRKEPERKSVVVEFCQCQIQQKFEIVKHCHLFYPVGRFLRSATW